MATLKSNAPLPKEPKAAKQEEKTNEALKQHQLEHTPPTQKSETAGDLKEGKEGEEPQETEEAPESEFLLKWHDPDIINYGGTPFGGSNKVFPENDGLV